MNISWLSNRRTALRVIEKGVTSFGAAEDASKALENGGDRNTIKVLAAMGRYFRNVRYGSSNLDVGLDAVLTLEMLLGTLIGRGRRGGAGSGHWMRPTPWATPETR
jgi:hypothetical protein